MSRMPASGGQWFVLPPLQQTQREDHHTPSPSSYTPLSISAAPTERKGSLNDYAAELRRQKQAERKGRLLAGFCTIGGCAALIAWLLLGLKIGQHVSVSLSSPPPPPSHPPFPPGAVAA